MKLIDVKLPKKTKKELEAEMTPDPEKQEQYPWGLRLTFEEKTIKKIPVPIFALLNLLCSSRLNMAGKHTEFKSALAIESLNHFLFCRISFLRIGIESINSKTSPISI